jgi:small subunit ribosomal protein S2
MSISSIGMKDLLEAGVHFGHKSASWNPRMKKFIFMKRKGVHIIDLQKTLAMAEEAYTYVKNEVANGKRILFVGTKKQARQAIEEAAVRCGQYFISTRWIGGLLTNFKTVKGSLAKLKYYETIATNDEEKAKYKKKQLGKFEKERVKLMSTLGGIREMKKLPDILFVVDAFHEAIGIAEARKSGIPVVGLVDTNSNPDTVDVVIPGNDDAIRSITLFVNYIAEAVIEGRAMLPEGGEGFDIPEAAAPAPVEAAPAAEAGAEKAEGAAEKTDEPAAPEALAELYVMDDAELEKKKR